MDNSSTSLRVITRKRDRLACVECRRRKLKCDRSAPCGTCIKRDKVASCSYERHIGSHNSNNPAESRLSQLEKQVKELMSCREDSAGVAATTQTTQHHDGLTDIDTNGFTQRQSGDISVYSGATHWSAVSEDIRDVQASSSSPSNELNEAQTPTIHVQDTSIAVLFGSSSTLSIEVVLKTMLPPRRQVDSFVAAYFHARALTAPFIHSSQFRRMYKEFWQNPAGSSPLWISMLFSICHIATNSLKISGGSDDPTHFSKAAAHCLTTGRYFEPRRFSVEALLLYVQSLCLTSQNIDLSMGPLFGILVRQAISMGYHREASNSLYSFFEGEMRRRTWSLLMQLDLLVSFHLGLPSGVQCTGWDMEIPRNLLDSDFDETILELPPSRPESEATEIMFYITKHRFAAVLEKILRHTLTSKKGEGVLYNAVDFLHQEVDEVYSKLPDAFRPCPIADSVVDPPTTIVTRLCVTFLYNKCICVLHRPYISSRELSTRIALQAATSLVESFVDAYYEFLPGGHAETERWFLGSLSWHDLLLGTMVLCLCLWADSKTPKMDLIKRQSTVVLLQRACIVIDERVGGKTPETAKVGAVIKSTLRRFPTAKSSSLPNSASMELQTDYLPVSQSTGETWHWDNLYQCGGVAGGPAWEDLERFMDLDGDLGLGS